MHLTEEDIPLSVVLVLPGSFRLLASKRLRNLLRLGLQLRSHFEKLLYKCRSIHCG